MAAACTYYHTSPTVHLAGQLKRLAQHSTLHLAQPSTRTAPPVLEQHSRSTVQSRAESWHHIVVEPHHRADSSRLKTFRASQPCPRSARPAPISYSLPSAHWLQCRSCTTCATQLIHTVHVSATCSKRNASSACVVITSSLPTSQRPTDITCPIKL